MKIRLHFIRSDWVVAWHQQVLEGGFDKWGHFASEMGYRMKFVPIQFPVCHQVFISILHSGIDAILHKKWKILGEIVVLEQNVNHFNTDTSQHHHRYIFPLSFTLMHHSFTLMHH